MRSHRSVLLSAMLSTAACNEIIGANPPSLIEGNGGSVSNGGAGGGGSTPTGGATGTGGTAGYCGDNITQNALGEECDDGGKSDADACSAVCKEQTVIQISAGHEHSCAILNGGRVKCWGNNIHGQLGMGDTETRGDQPGEMGAALPFVELGQGETAKSIGLGFTHTCALLSSGKVKCWGNGGNGQLGLGTTDSWGDELNEMGDMLPAIDLGAGRIALALAVGGDHNCALLDNGALKCWGRNSKGQLGLGDMDDRGDQPNEMGDSLPPIDLGFNIQAANVSAGAYHTCATLSSTGDVKCWGSNLNGQLGLGDKDTRGDGLAEMADLLPTVDLGPGMSASMLRARGHHSCAILSDDTLKCWGLGSSGELGLGDTASRGDDPAEMGAQLPAVDLGNGKTAFAAETSIGHTCALLVGGDAKCWGNNGVGALGLGNSPQNQGGLPNQMGDSLLAIDLGSGKKAVQISIGTDVSCALLDDGSMKCWGANNGGQLGLGDKENRGDQPDEMGDNLPIVRLFNDSW